MNDVFITLFAFLLGGVGWSVTNFFGQPFLSFYELRKQIQEAIIVSNNIHYSSSEKGIEENWAQYERERFFSSQQELRRLSAKLTALRVCSPNLERMLLYIYKIDMHKGAGGVMALSNSLFKEVNPLDQGSRAISLNKVETALKLPKTVTDEQVDQIHKRWNDLN